MSRTIRFKDIIPNINSYTFHIIGCGAIGSSAALQIARTGAEQFVLYDMDEVGEENVGVSQYNLQHIGMMKVEALEQILNDICIRPNINLYPGKFTTYTPQGKDIVILGFDNMVGRLEVIKEILKRKPLPTLVIDGRMGSETYIQYVFPKITLKAYEDVWFPDRLGSTEPCTAKATSYCSNMAGSFITETVGRVLSNRPVHHNTVFNFPAMLLQVQ